MSSSALEVSAPQPARCTLSDRDLLSKHTCRSARNSCTPMATPGAGSTASTRPMAISVHLKGTASPCTGDASATSRSKATRVSPSSREGGHRMPVKAMHPPMHRRRPPLSQVSPLLQSSHSLGHPLQALRACQPHSRHHNLKRHARPQNPAITRYLIRGLGLSQAANLGFTFTAQTDFRAVVNEASRFTRRPIYSRQKQASTLTKAWRHFVRLCHAALYEAHEAHELPPSLLGVTNLVQ